MEKPPYSSHQDSLDLCSFEAFGKLCQVLCGITEDLEIFKDDKDGLLKSLRLDDLPINPKP